MRSEIWTRRQRESIKRPIRVPVSPSGAVECYPCREVPLNYSDSLLFHGGDTGSTPVRDARILRNLGRQPFLCNVKRQDRPLPGSSLQICAMINVRNSCSKPPFSFSISAWIAAKSFRHHSNAVSFVE